MNIVIVEDELHARKRLQDLLESEINDINHLSVFENVGDTLDYLSKNQTELLFLDLNLGDKTGFEILEKIKHKSFYTIIVSGHIERAIDAYEFGVTDFLVKPVSRSRLRQALDRVADLDRKSVRYIGVESKSELKLLKPDDIFYIEKSNSMTNYICKNEKLASRQNLSEIIKTLPEYFHQIHRSFILNQNHIKSFESESGGRYSVIMKHGETLPVGRSYYKKVKSLLINSIN